MKTQVTIQGINYDIYPSGYDLSHAGKILSFTYPHNLSGAIQSSQQFAELLLNFNPTAVNLLSSFFFGSEQVKDIQQRLESGDLVVVQQVSDAELQDLNLRKYSFAPELNLPKPIVAATLKNKKRVRSPGSIIQDKAEQARISYQIVVEIAGRNLSQKQSLFMYKAEDEPSQQQFSVNDNKQPHRSLVSFQRISQQERRLGLGITMSSSPSPLVLPLHSQVSPCKPGVTKAEWENIIIPVKPLCTLSDNHTYSSAGLLRKGWLYLFWKGILWRELEVKDNTALRDVRVEWYRNQICFGVHKQEAPREAEGHWLRNVWVPYKINNEYQLGHNGVRTAFSEAQWSWDSVQSIENNTDMLLEKTSPLDAIQQYSKQQNFEPANADASKSEVSSIAHALTRFNESDATLMSQEQQQKIAVIYLSPDINNTLGLRRSTVEFSIVIQNSEGQFISRCPYEITLSQNKKIEGISNEKGEIKHAIAATQNTLQLTVWPRGKTSNERMNWRVQLDQLPPQETAEEWVKELNNLNYVSGHIDAKKKQYHRESWARLNKASNSHNDEKMTAQNKRAKAFFA